MSGQIDISAHHDRCRTGGEGCASVENTQEELAVCAVTSGEWHIGQ
ncbi:hypothetical protein F4553_007036 [Allocatelliglobosispora scoriae]|uniref:Uncharacterized protein n=1 Tax=Allocatelliglobosispora scoriae TaxID=643052 RepID=A0A841C3H1_9ACTN|nr:hypothetical protein [Allocatelliglobosispora scoriae]MBB5873602.1 hypothetical protein [Allocatelliglobosispora scoriae]